MSNVRGEIARSEPGRIEEQLAGRVWLGQKRNNWPVTVMTSESQVISYLKEHRDAVVWEYSITPVKRVGVVSPAPYLEEHSGD